MNVGAPSGALTYHAAKEPMTNIRLDWPSAGVQMADWILTGRALLLDTMRSDSGQPRKGSPAWTDRVTLYPGVGSGTRADSIATLLLVGAGEFLGTLEVLFQSEQQRLPTIGHIPVIRAYFEAISDVVWLIGSGFHHSAGPSTTAPSATDNEDRKWAQQRMARAVLLEADSLRSQLKLLRESHGEKSSEFHEIEGRFRTLKEEAQQWSAADPPLTDHPRGKRGQSPWKLKGEKLETSTDLMAAAFGWISQQSTNGPYRYLSGISHANPPALLERMTRAAHDDHTHYRFQPDYAQLEDLGFAAIEAWSIVGEALLVRRGLPTAELMDWDSEWRSFTHPHR